MDKLTILECADQLIEIMRIKHYSESSLYNYRKHFTDFYFYSIDKGKEYFEEVVAIEYANSVTGLELKDLAQDNKNTKKYIVLLRALRILGEYSLTRTFTSRFSRFHEPVEENLYWNQLYDSFMLYLKTDCDYKPSTIKRKEIILRKMMNILIELKISSIDTIDKSIIETIISSFIHETPKSVTHNLGDLKQFFQFCFDNSISKMNIVSLFPVIKTPHETKIPNTLTVDETNKLLNTIDKNDPKGKRDYAILMIASHLGLRAIDIINLKLKHFNWELKTITITQEKTNHTITLPLLNDVGWSIIDYIKNGRPNVDSEYVFIEHRAPYENFKSSGAVSRIFSTRMHDAKLNIQRNKRLGIHSLRHTLGTALLEKETPLPIISQILGHQSIKSTETYIKTNLKGLSECPIDPERVFNDEI